MSWEELLFFGFLGGLGLIAIAYEAAGRNRWRWEPKEEAPLTAEEEQWQRELDVLQLADRHKYC